MAKFLVFCSSPISTSIFNLLRLYKAPFIFFKLKNIEQIYPIAAMALESELPKDSHRRVEVLSQLQIPSFILYGSNERFIPKSWNDLLHSLLNIKVKTVFTEDDPNLLFPFLQQTSSTIFSSYVLNYAGHFPHAKYPKITNKLIEHHIKIS